MSHRWYCLKIGGVFTLCQKPINCLLLLSLCFWGIQPFSYIITKEIFERQTVHTYCPVCWWSVALTDHDDLWPYVVMTGAGHQCHTGLNEVDTSPARNYWSWSVLGDLGSTGSSTLLDRVLIRACGR